MRIGRWFRHMSGDEKTFQQISAPDELVEYIQAKEKEYMDKLLDAFTRRSVDIQSWFDSANLVKATWTGKMKIDPRNELESWGQVAENVFVGAIHILFPSWIPIGLPIGSETRLETADAIIHIDLKTHREGDSDLDRTQDVRPEQISGCGDISNLFPSLLPSENTFVEDSQGRLGEGPPKLPPYYDFGQGRIKLCITMFIICAYDADLSNNERRLSRFQLFCVPNGIARHLRDYRDIFQVGKNGRDLHRYRVNLVDLARHEGWRWSEVRATKSIK